MAYSSQSYSTAGTSIGIRGVFPSLPRTSLAWLRNLPSVDLDRKDRDEKTREKQQIVALNDKFVAFIDKVHHLQQDNKVLEARLKLLLEQETYMGSIDDIVAELSCSLRSQMDTLASDRKKLEDDLAWSQEQVEHQQRRYEEEIQKKTQLENDFVLRKKDVDEVYLKKVHLELDLEDLTGELDFLSRGYAEEIKALQSKIQNATVVVEVNNRHSLDMQQVVQVIKVQYEDMAARGWDEAELWHQKKVDDMAKKAQKHEQDMQDLRRAIGAIVHLIQRLNSDVEALKEQRETLEAAIQEAQNRGQLAHGEAQEQIRQLQEALNQTKQDLARQVYTYQDLMNVKLALDIEIATYRKLLEEEESRLSV